MQEKNLLNKIMAGKAYFSGVDKKIAEVLLKNPEKFITYSMAELAEIAGVSQGSIINFSKKTAGAGYSALKMKIAQELNDYKPQTLNMVDEADKITDIMKKKIEDTIRAFHGTTAIIGEETLKKAVKMILSAKKIEIYGIYHSGIVAMDFYFQLLKLGLPAIHITDTLMCSVAASMLDKDCLAIAISSSGRTKDILDAISIAKENGASTLCITCNENGAIPKICDEVLTVSTSDSQVNLNDEEARMGQIFVIDAICSYIRHRTEKTNEKQFKKMNKILYSHSVED